MDVLEAIKNRRSIRHYQSTPLDEATVQTVLEAAHWAPSWGNKQCWHFIVVRQKETREKIADTLSREYFDGEHIENAAASAIKQAPVLIVVCAELGKAGCQPDGTPATDKGDCWYMFDTGLAMENLSLAACSLGLGTVIVGAFDAAKVARFLGVPDGFSVVAMTPLGVPDHKGQVSPRKALSSAFHQEKF
jgi:nitroreductase